MNSALRGVVGTSLCFLHGLRQTACRRWCCSLTTSWLVPRSSCRMGQSWTTPVHRARCSSGSEQTAAAAITLELKTQSTKLRLSTEWLSSCHYHLIIIVIIIIIIIVSRLNQACTHRQQRHEARFFFSGEFKALQNIFTNSIHLEARSKKGATETKWTVNGTPVQLRRVDTRSRRKMMLRRMYTITRLTHWYIRYLLF